MVKYVFEEEPDYLTALTGGNQPVLPTYQFEDEIPQRNISTTEDVIRGAAGGVGRGIAGAVMTLPNLLNTAVAGPQYLYAAAKYGDKAPFQPWQPFISSDEALDIFDATPYSPQTTAGKVASVFGEVGGGAATVGGMQKAVSPPKSIKPIPSEYKDLQNLPKAMKGAKGEVNPLEVGSQAIQKINARYDADTQMQRQLYGELNKVGGKLSIKLPELYGKMDDMINYLKDKVAIDTPEHRAMNELIDIRKNMEAKYGIAGTPDKTMQMPSWKRPMVTQKGTPAQEAYGIEPADLVEIKTVLNSGLKTTKFPTAGGAKIMGIKKYVQDGLGKASQVSPEFGKALTAAEKQAARVGEYKSQSLRNLWNPEDYVSWKAAQNRGEAWTPSPDTLSRTSRFLENVNTKDVSKASVVSRILGENDANEIFKASIKLRKEKAPNVLKSAYELATFSPTQAAKTFISSFTAPTRNPLLDTAKNIQAMQTGQPIYTQSIGDLFRNAAVRPMQAGAAASLFRGGQ